ncbi:L,D-transpeptidase [Paenibacillus sp. 2RAB27]|uniref:L,D-transpeptidase n=1 Tax=Paenibacillus sp. 2RAB27 TaxID=3232991 RepID=UPI003F99B355
MFRLFSLFRILIIVSIVLSGCQSAKAVVVTQLNTIPNAAVTAPEEPLSSQNIADLPSRDSQPVVDWTQPSGGEYPKVSKEEAIWIDVSIDKQRVYIKDGERTLYTMVTSSGLDTSPDNSTPKGTFYVQSERGEWFYNNSEHEGAKYYVSWKNHGEFLFHTVAMDKNGNVIEEEAKKLGQKASHGCFRLTISDAKWLYDHIPVKTKVVVRN